MKRILLALAAATVLSSPAFAAKIGVSMAKFDDNFLTVLRNGMIEYAKTHARRHAADRGRQGRRLQATRARSRTSSPTASTRSSSTRSTPRPPRR